MYKLTIKINSFVMSLFGRKLSFLYSGLLAYNIIAWGLAFYFFRFNALLMSTTGLAFLFGLKHAFDADHIAAIDNVTRKFMQVKKKPVTIGLYFSMGHSSVLFLATLIIGLTLLGTSASGHINNVAGIIGTSVSALFLFIMAYINLIIAKSTYMHFNQLTRTGIYHENSIEELLNKRGLMSRIFRRAFKMVTKSWHMLPIGFLFGLGFDTATEVMLLSVVATQAAEGMNIFLLLIFPMLFSAGMTLMDSTDGVMMLGAYGWAFIKPVRKLYYNLVITIVSVILAIIIGGIESIDMLVDELHIHGVLRHIFDFLNGNFGYIGLSVAAIFLLVWITSTIIYKAKNYDSIQENGSSV
ncbi:HoxN/HupN/NixA family nickel/cobalt transporter [Acidithiobacillus sp. M4-SHS-6]|uniref:HoxN/HupN/NixA family nickel/cobalt transporter n=1 Tax=Acidithiobacillus sp. M4-SHS-6 TaxID=3383024 RepID=UPI0039BDB5A9